MVNGCTHSSFQEVERRWTHPTLKDRADITHCSCCFGPAQVEEWEEVPLSYRVGERFETQGVKWAKNKLCTRCEESP